jgi:hypothetical protein
MKRVKLKAGEGRGHAPFPQARFHPKSFAQSIGTSRARPFGEKSLPHFAGGLSLQILSLPIKLSLG